MLKKLRDFYFISVMLALHNVQSNAQHALIDYSSSRLYGVQQIAGCVKQVDIRDPRRLQVWSINQFEAQGGSGASCGYHALRNGILLAKSVIFADRFQQYSSDLYSYQQVDALFGPKGRWRSFIMLKRVAQEAKKYCDDALTGILQTKQDMPLWNQSESNVLRARVPDVAGQIAQARSVCDGGYHFAVDNDQLLRIFFQKIAPFTQPLADGQLHRDASAYNAVNNQAVLSRYFKDATLNFIVPTDGGDWIKMEEFPPIIDAERAQGMMNEVPGLIITNYGANIGGVQLGADILAQLNAGPGSHSDLDEFALDERFRELKREMTTTQHDVVGVVLVYVHGAAKKVNWVVQKINSWWGWLVGAPQADAYTQMNAENTNGHWFTLVVARLQGQTQYLIADSAANYSRLQDSKVNEIIAHLEGRRPQPTAVVRDSSSSSTAAIFKPDALKVAAVSPALASRPLTAGNPVVGGSGSSQVQAPAATGMSLTAKLGYTALIGVTAYAGWTVYKKYTAQQNQRNTATQAQSQTTSPGQFLI